MLRVLVSLLCSSKYANIVERGISRRCYFEKAKIPGLTDSDLLNSNAAKLLQILDLSAYMWDDTWRGMYRACATMKIGSSAD